MLQSARGRKKYIHVYIYFKWGRDICSISRKYLSHSTTKTQPAGFTDAATKPAPGQGMLRLWTGSISTVEIQGKYVFEKLRCSLSSSTKHHSHHHFLPETKFKLRKFTIGSHSRLQHTTKKKLIFINSLNNTFLGKASA